MVTTKSSLYKDLKLGISGYWRSMHDFCRSYNCPKGFHTMEETTCIAVYNVSLTTTGR